MTRVKLVGHWASSPDLMLAFARQCKAAYVWEDVTLTTDDTADYFVLFNFPSALTGYFDPNRTVVVHHEPPHAVAQWGPWATPDPRRFLQVRDHARYGNCAEWYLDATWQTLHTIAPVKNKILSAVVSSRNLDPGQRLRIAFIKYLQEQGQAIDVYGRGNDAGFAPWLGPLPARDKRFGLQPYRYTIAVENSAHPNYFTEKIHDALLMECLPFYWGCPNIDAHLDPQAFIQLPLDDFERSRALVREAIANDEWHKRLPAIREARRRILDELQLMPTIARVFRGHRRACALDIHLINLDRRADRLRAFHDELAARTSPAFAARVQRQPAIDGRTLRATPEISHLFRGNDFGSARGVIGCALTHLLLWRQFATQTNPAAWHLVFEDDTQLCPGFEGQLIELCGLLDTRHPNAGVVLLGYSSYAEAQRPKTPPAPSPGLQLRRFDGDDYIGGAYAYLISAAAARTLVAVADAQGVQQGIDRFLHYRERDIEILCATPPLATSPLALVSNQTDTDIHRDATPILY